MVDDCENCENVELKYGMRIKTNEEYRKRYRTQSPFVGSIVRVITNSDYVEVLKNKGNRISIQRRYITLA